MRILATLLLASLSTGCVINLDPDGGSGGGSGSSGGGFGSTGGGFVTSGGGAGATGGGSGVALQTPVMDDAVPGDQRVDLEWSSVSGAFEYDVYQGTSASTLSLATTVNFSSATITGLTNGTTYYFAVIARGAGSPSSQSNVVSATPSTPAVDVIGTTPTAGATGVPRDQTLELRFSQSVQEWSTMLSITPDVPLDWEWNGADTKLSLTPTSGSFAANTTYTLTLTAVTSSSGTLQLRAPFSLTFTTGATPPSREETVPQVTAVDPPNGAVDVTATPYITVTFNKAMDWASVVNALSMTPDAGFYNCAQQMNYTQFRCSTDVLARGTTYTLHVGTGATSQDTGALTLPAPFTSSFTTLAPDTTPPTVVSYTPSNAAQGQDRSQQVSITFSEPMDCTTTRNAFTFVSPARTLSSLGSCTGSQTTHSFYPSTPFAYGDNVSWKLATTATDTAGNALTAQTMATFKIARVATQTLQVVGSLEGTVTDAGLVNTTDTSLHVGTLAGNVEQRAFLTFDLSQLPASTTGISAATLNIVQTGTTGAPFTKFTNVGAYGLNYGNSLDAADYWIANDTHLDYLVILLPPFIVPYSATDYTSVSAGTSALPVTRNVDVSQQTSRQWGERSNRGNRMQLRLAFTGIQAADGGTNATGANDEVRFNSSKAVLDKPTLVVDYEYP
jgi:hypothetical protein